MEEGGIGGTGRRGSGGCSEGVTEPTGVLVETAAADVGVQAPAADVTCGMAVRSLFPAPFSAAETLTISTAGCTRLGVPDLFWNFDVFALARTLGDPSVPVPNNTGSPYEMDDGGAVTVRLAEAFPASYANVSSTEAGSRLLLLPGIDSRDSQEVQVQLWRFTSGTMSGSITAANLRGNPAACAVKASLSNLERNTAYHLYYNYDEPVPTLIASGQSTKRGTLSISGQLSKVEFAGKELGRFFVTEVPLYTGTGDFGGSTRMLLFSGKLTATRCT